MNTPYENLPASAFWRKSVSSIPEFLIDPVAEATFRIGKSDLVATAGSCFAQHLSRAIQSRGFRYLITEAGDDIPLAERHSRNYGGLSARFGNLYTVRQLRQLIERAYGIAEYEVEPWIRSDGRFADPFRPQIEPTGFVTREELYSDRERHLRAVREMFSSLNVLVFTMGLTEGWEHIASGATLPLAPGVAAGEWDAATYRFANYTTAETLKDLEDFFTILKSINASAKMLLTVSPVPLIATYSPNSVLAATSYSKAVLRVVAEEFSRKRKGVDYFPSYEIITSPAAGNKYFDDDLRNIKEEGVAHVMRSFFKHYVNDSDSPSNDYREYSGEILNAAVRAQNESAFRIVCDEESIEKNLV